LDRAELLESRIRWRIGREFPSLPVGRTCFFEQLSEELRAPIAAASDARDAGRPVLVAADSPDRWTLLGTSAILSYHSGRFHECRLAEIADLHPRDRMPPGLSPDEHARWKSSWEYLSVSDQQGSHKVIWLPAGEEAFAFWSTLLMLGRMCAGLPNYYD
jgi:hypothetical protein